MLDAKAIRKDFPILDKKIGGHPLIYLDNAATTQKPRQVLDSITNYYQEHNANVNRAIYTLAKDSTRIVDDARGKVGGFIRAPSNQIIFTKNATESLNLVARSYGSGLGAGDEIVISLMEHHSNIVPWKMLEEKGIKVRFAGITGEGKLDMEDMKGLINSKTKVVSIGHASNVLGTINDVKAVGELAHDADALFVVDGAQAVPHFPVDVQRIDADFYAFSSHKMLGPTGVGVLYGKSELLEGMPPFLGGGEMIDQVTTEKITYSGIPHKFEAGTPDMAGIVGLGAAVDYLRKLGMDEVQEHELALTRDAMDRLGAIEGLRIFGPGSTEMRTSAISFVIEGITPQDLAEMADTYGVCLRTGNHCAQPLHDHLKVPGTARASYYVYNTKEDTDVLIEALEKAKGMFS